MFINHLSKDVAYLLTMFCSFHPRPALINIIITYLHGNVGASLAQSFDSVKGVY